MIKIYGLKNNKVNSLGLGIFDGFHLGHQEIMRHCDFVLTFWPHPDIFLEKNSKLKMLSTLKELRYYTKNLLVLHFTNKIANMTAEEFLDAVILKINPKKIVVGYDFKFGYQQKGDIALLKEWGHKHQIKVVEVPPIRVQDQIIKSSNIRNAFAEDKFDQALIMFGHSYLLIGKVIKGESRGRTLGFPTANLFVIKQKLLPTSGVYGGKVMIADKIKNCLIYLGHKPTFGKHKLSIEVFILDFNGDLYEQHLKVFIEKKIRPEIKFNSQEELVTQMQSDLKSSSKGDPL